MSRLVSEGKLNGRTLNQTFSFLGSDLGFLWKLENKIKASSIIIIEEVSLNKYNKLPRIELPVWEQSIRALNSFPIPDELKRVHAEVIEEIKAFVLEHHSSDTRNYRRVGLLPGSEMIINQNARFFASQFYAKALKTIIDIKGYTAPEFSKLVPNGYKSVEWLIRVESKHFD